MSSSCLYCWEVLHCHLNSKPVPEFDQLFGIDQLGDRDIMADGGQEPQYPLFVTWKRSRDDRLRGCIGNFTPMPLSRGLREYALIAALEDSRFPPIRLAELQHLSCSVSLLTDFQDCQRWDDWTVGLHGIKIEFKHPSTNRHMSGTYLPQIAQEQGWSKRETLDSLLLKAGFNDGGLEDVLPALRIQRYSSRITSASWDEYSQWRRNLSASS